MGILLTKEDGVNFEHHPDLEHLLKAQLKKVVGYLDTLTFYDDWGGESGKKTVDMIQQALLKEIE